MAETMLAAGWVFPAALFRVSAADVAEGQTFTA